MKKQVFNTNNLRKCSRCGKEKEIKYFSKDKSRKDELNCQCKECRKEYHKEWYENNKEKKKEYYENNKEKKKEYKENNKEKIKEQMKEYKENNKEKIKEYYENNKEKIKEQMKEYYENNKEKKKEYNNSPLLFNSITKYRKEIELYEEVKESTDGNLMCKCAYCGEWFEPTKSQIKSRIDAINGKTRGDLRLYCSNSCKCNCPIYWQQLYPKDKKPATSREVQPELRQLVFARDNYTCQKCNTHRDNLEVGIHCHHKEGILWEPLQSADMDMCITLCEDCHKEVHGIDGCGYQDMQCK